MSMIGEVNVQGEQHLGGKNSHDLEIDSRSILPLLFLNVVNHRTGGNHAHKNIEEKIEA